MTADLRIWWAMASPRERDAKVARALEWTVKSDETADDLVIETTAPDGAWTRIEISKHSPAISQWFAGSGPLPEYSTSWEHAGLLLEGLKAAGWSADVYLLQGSPVALYLFQPLDADDPAFVDISVSTPTLPEAIALAFCLAKEAQP